MFPWGTFPFNEDAKKWSEQMSTSDIQSFVNEMLKKYLPSQMENIASQQNSASNHTINENQHDSKRPDTQVFETFDFVFIRIHLLNEDQKTRLKFFHTSNLAIIENFFEDGDRFSIPLPCLVKRKGAVALIKDLILEVKIPKNIDMQFTEVDITEK
ncbi:Hsp20/alpha crystallin family protein [Siminovitchia sediminis]|uniref:Hsp20/alpha crystallin family protein n=1 Tax=Siminovitchia sediminis TaxID=1274353 RepID=A0ABW4KGL1_9BACI